MAESALNNIYGSVVSAIFSSVPEIKTVDIDLGQLEKKPPQIFYEEPAVLFRIENIIWSEYDASKQIGLVHVRLRLIFSFDDDEDINYTEVHTVRTSVYDFCVIAEKIHDAVRALTGYNYSKLIRLNQRHHVVEDKTMKWMHVFDYVCNVFSDNSDIDVATLAYDYDLVNKWNVMYERRRLVP